MVNKTLAEFAATLWSRFFAKRVQESQRTMLRYYTATVTAAASGGKLAVKRPFDAAALQVGYVASMANAKVGDSVVVLVFGDGVNLNSHKVFMYPDGSNL